MHLHCELLRGRGWTVVVADRMKVALLVLAHGNCSVKSISGLLNVPFTSEHHSHVLCGMSMHNIYLESGPCFASRQNWIFGCRSVIVGVVLRDHCQETDSAPVNVSYT